MKQISFLIVLVLLFSINIHAQRHHTESKKPDLLTGNLSVNYLRWTVGSIQGTRPEPDSPGYFDSLRNAGVDGIEDYLTFVTLEPKKDQPDWYFYRQNCDRVHAAGMRYGVYPWLHFPPDWFVNSPDYVPYLCMEHGLPTYSTSIWAPGTLAMYDRFYGQLRDEFGDEIEDIHASMPADYGEVGFPVGMSAWVVPQEHKHLGFWCGDRFARKDFRDKMQEHYGTLALLNHNWGTQFSTWEEVEYPPMNPPENDDAAARRRWLDFIDWYTGSQTEFTRKSVRTIRKHFPETPIQIKLGYGGEYLQYGVDNTAVVRMAAENNIIVRSTHGSLPAFFYKRFSTAVEFYGGTLLTEPPSNVEREEEVARIFNDATNLSTCYFDYPVNIFRAQDIFDAYLPLIEGEKPYIKVAFMFPTSDHRLRSGQNLPSHLLDQAGTLRDITDYGLVDENLVRDGALRDFRLLVLFEGQWFEQETLDSIAAWVHRGGNLLLNNTGAIANIEGDTHSYLELLGPLALKSGDKSLLTVIGDPDAGRLDSKLLMHDFSRTYGTGKVVFFPFGPEEDQAFREAVSHLIYHEKPIFHPPIDPVFDSIQAAILETRLMFINPTSKTITKMVNLRTSDFQGIPGPAPPDKDLLLEMAPHSITVIERSDGTVLAPLIPMKQVSRDDSGN